MKRLAYIVSRFPKTTETFILNEVNVILDTGIELDVYTLLGQKQFLHKDSAGLENRTHRPRQLLHALSGLSYWITRKPGTVVKLLATICRELITSPKVLLKTLILFPRFLYIAKRCKLADVGHIHCGFANYAATAALVSFHLTHIGFSITGHANDLFRSKGLLKEKLEHCTKCFVISAYNRQYLQPIVKAEHFHKIEIIRAGADTRKFTYKPYAALQDQAQLLCVASLTEKKGHNYLLKALALLKSDGFNFHCDLVGDGPLRSDLEQQVTQLDLTQSVTLHGAVSAENVQQFMVKANLFVLPCVEARDGVMDGIPVAIMEAMGSGVPVVTTGVSGIPELVVHNATGLLAAQRDEQDLANQISQLLKDEQLCHTIATAANARVRQQYDMHQNYQRKADAIAALLQAE